MISTRAKGIVCARLGYTTADGSVNFFENTGKIRNGNWSLTKTLPAGAATSGGQAEPLAAGRRPGRRRLAADDEVEASRRQRRDCRSCATALSHMAAWLGRVWHDRHAEGAQLDAMRVRLVAFPMACMQKAPNPVIAIARPETAPSTIWSVLEVERDDGMAVAGDRGGEDVAVVGVVGHRRSRR